MAALVARTRNNMERLQRNGARSTQGDWARCAADAYQALGATHDATAATAATLSTYCSDRFLALALAEPLRRWSEGKMDVGDEEVYVEFRGISSYRGGPLALVRAQDVPIQRLGGKRYSSMGLGVALAMLAPRCDDRPLCKLVPPEGVFRWATAWVESEPQHSRITVVIADPLAMDPLQIGKRRYPLALDTSAFYAHGVQASKLDRLAIWGLLGDDDVGRRAGLYLLEDYDPRKRPVIMIHGLGSSPLAWARLSNALWGDPELRRQFQVWHVVYQSDAPLLVERRRVQHYLDQAWHLLDPEGDDPARAGVVLVGHSLGGVISRMLTVDSGDVLWNAAFTAPYASLQGDAKDLQVVDEVFRFSHYAGVTRAIFMASPHRGSPGADAWFGRLAKSLIGNRVREMQALRRVSLQNPDAVRENLRATYQQAGLNSISTLQSSQPVRLAGESLMPAPGIAYHSIAGSLPGRQPETDGAVPLASTQLPGAASSLVVQSGHDVYDNETAIAEVLRILHQDLEERGR